METLNHEEVVSAVQRKTDPTGMYFQLDWEFIEPLFINAFEAIVAEKENDEQPYSRDEVTAGATKRVINAVNSIFFGQVTGLVK